MAVDEDMSDADADASINVKGKEEGDASQGEEDIVYVNCDLDAAMVRDEELFE